METSAKKQQAIEEDFCKYHGFQFNIFWRKEWWQWIQCLLWWSTKGIFKKDFWAFCIFLEIPSTKKEINDNNIDFDELKCWK